MTVTDASDTPEPEILDRVELRLVTRPRRPLAGGTGIHQRLDSEASRGPGHRDGNGSGSPRPGVTRDETRNMIPGQFDAAAIRVSLSCGLLSRPFKFEPEILPRIIRRVSDAASPPCRRRLAPARPPDRPGT